MVTKSCMYNNVFHIRYTNKYDENEQNPALIHVTIFRVIYVVVEVS